MKMSFCISVCVDHVAKYNVFGKIILSMKCIVVVVNSFTIQFCFTVKFVYNLNASHNKSFQGDFTLIRLTSRAQTVNILQIKLNRCILDNKVIIIQKCRHYNHFILVLLT